MMPLLVIAGMLRIDNRWRGRKASAGRCDLMLSMAAGCGASTRHGVDDRGSHPAQEKPAAAAAVADRHHPDKRGRYRRQAGIMDKLLIIWKTTLHPAL